MEGRFNAGFFALPVWAAYFWRGLYIWKSLFSEFYGSGNLLIGQVPFFPRSPDDVYPPVREEEQDDYLLSNLDMDISTSVIPPVSHAYYHLSRSRNP